MRVPQWHQIGIISTGLQQIQLYPGQSTFILGYYSGTKEKKIVFVVYSIFGQISYHCNYNLAASKHFWDGSRTSDLQSDCFVDCSTTIAKILDCFQLSGPLVVTQHSLQWSWTYIGLHLIDQVISAQHNKGRWVAFFTGHRRKCAPKHFVVMKIFP